MSRRHTPYLELRRLIAKPVFLLVDFFGIASLLLSQLLPGPTPFLGAFMAFGSALLTIGMSLPIALYYQLRASSKSLRILDVCNRSGIKALFEGRLSDARQLRSAIDKAVMKSNELAFLGIAFRSLFNPSGEYTGPMREKLDDPRINLRVLLLNPRSKAARNRAKIEQGNTTVEDIRYTLNHGIPTTIRERLKRRTHAASIAGMNPNDARDYCNCEVHLYNHDPILFAMIFRDSLFLEQYHYGRPDLLRVGSCIGKHVMVLEYAAGSQQASFFQKHYEYIWANSKDVTATLVKSALALGQKPEPL